MKFYISTLMITMLSMLIHHNTTEAKLVMHAEEFYSHNEAVTADDDSQKVAQLTKLMAQQTKLYEDKIQYLETELEKAKDRLVDKSINADKAQAFLKTRYNEELGYLKRELVAKTKTTMEYQRQLEKVKIPDEMKNLIKVNTELAVELRRSNDQLAIIQYMNKSDEGQSARMPASVSK